LSLDPDRTLNALVSLLPPVAALLVAAWVRERDLQHSLYAVAVIAGLSALVSMLQIGGVGGERLYYYDLASMGEVTGLFPNRNHNAALLVCGMTVIAHLRAAPKFAPVQLAAVAFLAVTVMLVQSRSGMIIGVLALLGSYRALARLVRLARGDGWRDMPQRRWRFYAIAVATAVFVALGALAAARSGSFARFVLAPERDTRFANIGTLVDTARHYFPAGSGLGSFDPVFRIAEPHDSLRPEYLNHAHNDLLETLITAGLPGLMLVAVFGLWLVRSVWRTWAFDNEPWAATLVVLVLLSQSVGDYPLRTPLLSIIFLTAMCWMCRFPRELYHDRRGD
jgi:O-antigen ligase